MSDLKSGDKVRLKSGGAPMTVTKVAKAVDTEEMTVWVTWFDANRNLQKDSFPPDALEVVVEHESGPIVINPSTPPITERMRRYFGDRRQ